jgi:AhpD family alkylhydroperoxidase
MSRVEPAPPGQYAPIFGEEAPLRQRIYSQQPQMATVYRDFGIGMRESAALPPRLVELVRLRIAFHNQCRTCMSVRYASGIEDGLSEELVCSLEKPEEAPDLTEPERAALAFADLMAIDHFAVDDAAFERLRVHFDEGEIMELCFHCANYIGFGRMAMVLDMVEDLPPGLTAAGRVAPWAQDDVRVI